VSELLKTIALANPFKLVDGGGNHTCMACGCFRDFRSLDGKQGAGQHYESCWWLQAQTAADVCVAG